MNYYDNHIHSNYSPDSKMKMEDIVRTAAERNLAGVVFTDHYDIDAPSRENEFIFDPATQQEEIDTLCNSGNIQILKGIEVGLQPDSLNKIREFTAQYSFDTVIASIHFIDKLDPYYGTYYTDKNYKEAYGRVFEVMYQTAVEYKDFDILGHFDYIARYAPYKNSERNITLAEFGDYLEPLLKFLAQNGKTFEVNTKTYKENMGHTPLLDLAILKRFRELGGEAISLGSDAHDLTRIGDNFEVFGTIIKNCGFRYLVYYKNRVPHFYNL
ncbi:MAG: histidinol-phosphatase HisJ family protein [Bacteroidales bacterium]